MSKLKIIIVGIVGVIIATIITDRFLNIEANPSHLFFLMNGLILGVLISDKK